MKYTITQWLHHIEQAKQESASWNSGSFKTHREQAAYEAGHRAGAQDSKNLIALHGGFKLSDPKSS